MKSYVTSIQPYWLATSDSGGRLHFAYAIKYLLSQRFDHFVEGNKRKAQKKLVNFLFGRKWVTFPRGTLMPTSLRFRNV